MKILQMIGMAGAIMLTPVLSQAAPEIGEAAPGFMVKDLDGKEHTLDSFKGKVVVLEWNNFDCPFVKRHYTSGDLPKMQKEYGAKGVVWLAVNSGAEGKQGVYPAAEMKARAEKEGFAGTAYVMDASGSAGKAYGAPTTPTMAVIDAEGKLRYWGALDDKPEGGEGATNYVGKALEAIMAGKEIEVTKTKPYGCGVKY